MPPDSAKGIPYCVFPLAVTIMTHLFSDRPLVRAKDKSGNPVMMVINPDSVLAVTEHKGQTNNATGNNTTRNNTPTGNED